MAAQTARIGRGKLQALHDHTEKLISEYKSVYAEEGHSESSIKAIRTQITANIVAYKNQKQHDSGSRSYDDDHSKVMKQAEAIVGYHEA